MRVLPRKMRIRNLFSALFFVFLALDWFGAVESGAETPKDEVDALKLIGKSLGKMDWNANGADPCSGAGGWITPPSSDKYGPVNNVTCNCSYSSNTVCHVVSISLKSQNLSGVLPPELVRLRFLQTLDLTRNFLHGPIPVQWGSSGLMKLSLLGNRLSGTIPKELGNIISLTELILEANQFSGPVPPELGNLTNLVKLLISSNPLTGQLPEELARLSNMKDFRMSDTNISGKIPDFIKSWSNLQTLAIQGCPMQGPIPSGISGLVNLTDLRISDINGTGSSFPNLTKMVEMETLVLRSCLISGNIPSDIAGMTPLQHLDLSFNNLTGKIPVEFGRLSKRKFMYFTNNSLTGPLPDWIPQKNINVDVSYNNLTWTSSVPTTCEQQTINLVGSCSSTMDKFADSCLKKDFPCAGSADNYNLYINCGGDELRIGDNTYEADLEGRGASTSHISKEKWAFSSTGNFMNDDQEIDHYTARNIFTQSMPDSQLYATARLSPLSLTYYGLCMINENYTVKLHFAEIMFTNGTTFGSLGRRIFDVYVQGKLVLKDFNIEDEAGGVGKAVVRTFTATVTSNTLEIHFLWTGKGTQSLPRRGVYGPLISAISVDPDFVPPGGKKISNGVIVGIVASVLCFILLVLVLLWKAGWLRHRSTRENELRALDLQTGSFTLRQIKAATNNFDPENKIGEGGFGSVYKGILADGTIIAVKQLSSKSKQGNREFVNEIGMITALQHPNLVKLYGCCIEGNQLSLIYEYMENNSLARALFHEEEGQSKLDWQTRRKICIGIARGLAYLHEESMLKIVHRDIKATNVLLDKDLNAKISDFGLAKLDEEENTHISTRIAGTIGYMAPEYAMRGYLTDKADVYSFGIVTLEIVSGKSNTNYRPKEERTYLLDWAYVLQERGKLAELIDPNLGSDFSMEEAMRMLKVGLLCTNASPTLRPTMSAAVSMLEGRTVIDDLISNVSSSSDDIMFKAIRNQSQLSRDHSQTQTQTQSMSIDGPWTGSSSSVPDLYPINMDSETWDNQKSLL